MKDVDHVDGATSLARARPGRRGARVTLALGAVGLLLAGLQGGCPARPTGSDPGPRAAPRRAAARPARRARAGPLRRALRQNLRQYRRRIRRCHELAMAEDYRLSGRLVLVLTVAPAGPVTAIRTRRNEPGSALLARCVAHVARGFVFPSSDAFHPVVLRLRFGRPRAKHTVRLDDVPARRVRDAQVTAKDVLTPRNVTGPRLALSAVRWEAGASLALPGLSHTVGIYVLRGGLQVHGAGPQPRALAGHRGGILRGRGGTVRLTNPGRQRSAALLFFAPPAAQATALGGDAPVRRTRPTRPRPPAAARARLARFSVGPARALDPRATGRVQAGPAPTAVWVRPGQRAVINPDASVTHHALIVIDGALWITLHGVRLPAEAGMAVSVPGGTRAVAVPAVRRPARLVLMPWPGQGRGAPVSGGAPIRFEKAPLPPPARRPRVGPALRVPGAP